MTRIPGHKTTTLGGGIDRLLASGEFSMREADRLAQLRVAYPLYANGTSATIRQAARLMRQRLFWSVEEEDAR